MRNGDSQVAGVTPKHSGKMHEPAEVVDATEASLPSGGLQSVGATEELRAQAKMSEVDFTDVRKCMRPKSCLVSDPAIRLTDTCHALLVQFGAKELATQACVTHARWG